MLPSVLDNSLDCCFVPAVAQKHCEAVFCARSGSLLLMKLCCAHLPYGHLFMLWQKNGTLTCTDWDLN